MKHIRLTLTIVTLFSLTCGAVIFDFAGDERSLSYRNVDANNISTYIWNTGMMDRANMGLAGFEWPKGSGKYAVYLSGLWVSCKVGDSIRVSTAYYDSHFKPGYFDYFTQTPMGADDTLYRLYKVSPQFPNGGNDFDSWFTWPVDQGAPWVDVNGNGTYEPPSDYPVMKGSQNLFCSFSDGKRDSLSAGRATPPLKAEVHLYAWARENQPCADAVNYEWTIINKSRGMWSDFSAAVFSDADLGTSNNDLAGTDSALGLVYTYNGNDNDPVYGQAPPAVGQVVRYADRHQQNRADFASRWRCPFDCPGDSLEMYRVLHGQKYDGTQWFDPYSNHETNFPFSGDPATQSGWRDSMPGDRYMLVGSLFGEVNSLDTIRFTTTSFIKRGSSNLNSVTELKNCVNSVIKVNDISNNTAQGFILHQNFPNPFNPVTTISYDLPNSGFVMLKVYDMLGREVKTLVNQMKIAGYHNAQFNADELASGAYFYRLSVSSNAGEFTAVKKCVVVK